MFHRQREWQSGPAANELWHNLVPGNTGVVMIKNPERYGLQPGLETEVEGAGVYTLSGAHQSHCIVSSKLDTSTRFDLLHRN